MSPRWSISGDKTSVQKPINPLLESMIMNSVPFQKKELEEIEKLEKVTSAWLAVADVYKKITKKQSVQLAP